jgi:hypothetical protein
MEALNTNPTHTIRNDVAPCATSSSLTIKLPWYLGQPNALANIPPLPAKTFTFSNRETGRNLEPELILPSSTRTGPGSKIGQYDPLMQINADDLERV